MELRARFMLFQDRDTLGSGGPPDARNQPYQPPTKAALPLW